MKNYYKKLGLPAVAALLFIGGSLEAQCPTINCPGTITVNNDSNSCGAVVTYTAPVGTNPCGAPTTVTYNYSGTIDTWTVPAGVTSIHIQAKGAQGGYNTNSGIMSGLGADMSGDFTVTPGQQLKILVGQQPSASSGNGGGGGTFVTDMSNTPLIVAGGGGGSASTTDSPDKHGQVGTSGGAGAAGGGAGGTAGSGGSIGASGFQSGAGGGLLTDGANGWTSGTAGIAFVNGGSGGTTNSPANGGFGGGGSGSSYVVGGGGGGYSGGGSGGNSSAGVGGGGGSYNAGTNQVNTGGANSGNGVVIITYGGSSSSVTTTMTAGLASGSTFPIGTTTQTYLVDDGLGNTASCSFDVIVVDNQLPVITAPADITVNSDSGICGAVVTFTAPVGTDNCSGATTALTAGLASGSTFPVGTTTETFTVTDAAGNTASASFNIIVIDNEAPMIVAPANITVNNDSGMCGAMVTYTAPVGTDNCSGATTVLTSGPASGAYFPLGTTTVTYTVTDGAGNMNSASFTVTVIDAEGPELIAPATITVSNDSGLCYAVVNYTAPVGLDSCSGATTALVSGLGSGAQFPIGTTTETYTSTDGAGNTTTVSFDVIVNDTEAPTIACGGNVSSCSAVVNNIDPGAVSDNCTNLSISYILTGATTGSGVNNASGNTFNTGVTTVWYIVTDGGGNTDTCMFDVTVFAAPTVTASAASTSVCVDDASVALTGSPAGGTWSGNGVTGNSFSPAAAGLGPQTLTYSYTDVNGCSNTAEVTVTVNACTGVAESALSTGVSVFPNPNAGTFSLAVNATIGDLVIEVSDLQGRTVFSSQENNVQPGFVKQISLETMPSGVYLLHLVSNGEQRTEKLVIQK